MAGALVEPRRLSCCPFRDEIKMTPIGAGFDFTLQRVSERRQG